MLNAMAAMHGAKPASPAAVVEPKPEKKATAKPKSKPSEDRVHVYNWRSRHGQTQVGEFK